MFHSVLSRGNDWKSYCSTYFTAATSANAFYFKIILVKSLRGHTSACSRKLKG